MRRPVCFKVYVPADGCTYPVNAIEWDNGNPYTICASGQRYRADAVHIMQFTGSKDLDGKEIYEDDLISEDSGEAER